MHPHPDGLGAADIVHEVWHELQEQSEVFLRSVSLQTLIDRSASRQPVPNYNI
jgi:hypothetical protein